MATNDLSDRIRSEAEIASRSGQMARLDDIADEVSDLLARAEKAEAYLAAAHSVIRKLARHSTGRLVRADEHEMWTDAEAAEIRAATADPTPESETS